MCCVALAEGSGEMNLPVSPTKLAAAAGPRGTELLLRGGPSCARARRQSAAAVRAAAANHGAEKVSAHRPEQWLAGGWCGPLGVIRSFE